MMKLKFREEDEPLKFFMGFKIHSLSEVDSCKQSFTVRVGQQISFQLTVTEYDALQEDAVNFNPKYCPPTHPYNGRSIEWEPVFATLEKANWCLNVVNGVPYAQKWQFFTGTFNENFEIRCFPFDVQELTIDMLVNTAVHGGQKIEITKWKNGCSFAGHFVEPQGEWTVSRKVSHSIEALKTSNFNLHLKSTLYVKRNWGFYF